jgi:hypothetical protein
MQDKKINRINLTEIYDKGTEVFGSLTKFTKWLLNDNIALENRKPIDVIKTEEGSKLVIAELKRIEQEIDLEILETNLFTQLTKNKEKFKLNVVTEKQNGFIVLIIPDLQLSSYGDTEEEAKEMLEACLLDYIKTIFKLEHKSKYINSLKIEWKKQSSETNLEIVITLLEKKLINKEDETVYLLNNPKNVKFLKESIKEVKQGKTISYTIDELKNTFLNKE